MRGIGLVDREHRDGVASGIDSEEVLQNIST
jgi:hypothetical protein